MTDRSAPLVKRLCQAEPPCDAYDWERQDGYYAAACCISAEDIPALIDLARKWSDRSWPGEADVPQLEAQDAAMLPIVAWRTLADIKAGAAVSPLIDMLCELDDEYDDWVDEELPHVFGKIGEPAMEPLTRLATSDDKPECVRAIAVRGLRWVAGYHPDTRDRVVARLAEMMADASAGPLHFNSTLLTELVDLGAVEAAEPIERAFAANLLDVAMMGDWEAVRRQLGVEGLGLKMPVNPHNSIGGLRAGLGFGNFSDMPIFANDENNAAAALAYYERVSEAFSKSAEARQVVERHGDLQWFRSLLEFGVNYLRQIVDAMTVENVEEFVLDFVPRKVSTAADSAASIVDELTMFWEYLDRVYKLPAARSIVEWLKSDGLVARLHADLSDPSNFGMAKSLFMLGEQAGYDMTSQAGVDRFVTAYNRSLPSNQPAAVPLARGQRVGRNAPCPCASGKKFKKCCGR